MEEERETVEEISSKTWNVMENNLRKEGFREGAAAGKKYVFQSSFDAGYREGFKVGYAKGFLTGFLSILKDEDNRAINLPDTKIDLSTSPCILCEEDIRQKLETNSIKEIISFLIENDKLSVTSLKKENTEICRILEFYSHCNK